MFVSGSQKSLPGDDVCAGRGCRAPCEFSANKNYEKFILNSVPALFFLVWGLPVVVQEGLDLVPYVNTLQGTNSTFELSYGNTYPTTALPFAMHTWTPQTGENGSGWKYQYFKDAIRCFQQAHQCSSWSGDYAVFSLMPVIGKLKLDENGRKAKFSHDNEIGKPHFYKVTFDNQITTEIAPTERGAHLRFSFPEGENTYIVLDGYNGLSAVVIDSENSRITGYVSNGRLVGKLKNYFILQFDQPLKAFGTWENRTKQKWPARPAAKGKGAGAYVEFAPGRQIQVKVASSYVSPRQAELTLEGELGAFDDLEETRAAARLIWNRQLGKVVVEGGTEEQKQTFYSCLFRANLFSRKFYEIDENGNPYYFSPYDLEVHKGYLFTDTGFWDTFRAQFPLNTNFTSNDARPVYGGPFGCEGAERMVAELVLS